MSQHYLWMGGGKMDFSKVCAFGFSLSILFWVGTQKVYSADLQIESSFSIDSVVVSSSWNSRATTFVPDTFEETLANALMQNSVFKRASVGGRSGLQATGEPSDTGQVQTHFFLKPSYANLPEMLLTLQRTRALSRERGGGSVSYMLTNPVSFYFDHWDVSRKPFSLQDVSLELSFSQFGQTVNFQTMFQMTNLLFVSWVNKLLSPLRGDGQKINSYDILLAMRSGFHAIHQYFSTHY